MEDKKKIQDIYELLCFKKSGFTTTLFAIVGNTKRQMAVHFGNFLKELDETASGILAR